MKLHGDDGTARVYLNAAHRDRRIAHAFVSAIHAAVVIENLAAEVCDHFVVDAFPRPHKFV